MIVLSAIFTQAMRRSEDIKGMLGAAAATLVAFLLGLELILQNLGWELRIDDKGIELHAPFDVMRPSGEVAWADGNGRVGLRFTEIPDSSRQQLEGWILRRIEQSTGKPTKTH